MKIRDIFCWLHTTINLTCWEEKLPYINKLILCWVVTENVGSLHDAYVDERTSMHSYKCKNEWFFEWFFSAGCTQQSTFRLRERKAIERESLMACDLVRVLNDDWLPLITIVPNTYFFYQSMYISKCEIVGGACVYTSISRMPWVFLLWREICRMLIHRLTIYDIEMITI